MNIDDVITESGKERGKIIRPNGNTVGLNVFEIPSGERANLNGTVAHHQTKKLDKILQSGGIRPRADITGENSFALDTITVGKDWRTPKGIFLSKQTGGWFGDEITFKIESSDKIVWAYNENGHLLMTNPVSKDRFITAGPIERQ